MLLFLLSCRQMRLRPVILQCTAIFLMMVFVQKSGAGLFLHNFLHTGSVNEDAPDTEDTKTVNYACTCVDDFLMPFDETNEVCQVHPFPSVFIAPVFPENNFVFYISVFSPLRGPPSV